MRSGRPGRPRTADCIARDGWHDRAVLATVATLTRVLQPGAAPAACLPGVRWIPTFRSGPPRNSRPSNSQPANPATQAADTRHGPSGTARQARHNRHATRQVGSGPACPMHVSRPAMSAPWCHASGAGGSAGSSQSTLAPSCTPGARCKLHATPNTMCTPADLRRCCALRARARLGADQARMQADAASPAGRAVPAHALLPEPTTPLDVSGSAAHGSEYDAARPSGGGTATPEACINMIEAVETAALEAADAATPGVCAPLPSPPLPPAWAALASRPALSSVG